MEYNSFLLRLALCSAPIIAALLGIAFLWLAGKRSGKNNTDTKLYTLLTIYLSTVALNWSFGIVLLFAPWIVASLNGLVYCLLLIVQPFLYHFLYVLTAGPDEKPFSRWHYAFPIAILVVVTVWSLQIPPEIRTTLEINKTGAVPDTPFYKYYSILTHSKSYVRLLYNLIYLPLGLCRIFRYRKKVVDFTADAGNSSLGWILFFLLLSFPLTLTPIILLPGSAYQALSSFRALLPALNMFIQIPILCYFTATHRYVVMKPSKPEMEDPEVSASRKPSRERLEKYMAAHKPYTKADLQITDLAGALKTNRSYLSSLINMTYGMNFSQFINGYRLHELNRLVEDPRNKDKNNLDLILKAGFGSYHSYYRAKKQQDKQTTLGN